VKSLNKNKTTVA